MSAQPRNGFLPNIKELTTRGEEHLTNIRELLALVAANVGEAVELVRANTVEEELHPLRNQALADGAGVCTVELPHRLQVGLELISYSLQIQTPPAAPTTLTLYRDSVEPPNLLWSDVVPVTGIMSNRIPDKVVLPHNSKLVGVIAGLTASTSIAFLNVHTRAVRVSGAPPYEAVSP